MFTTRIIIASVLFSYAWIGAMDHEAQQWKTAPNKQWQKKGNEKHKPIRNVGNESARENHMQGNDLLLHLWRKTNIMFNILNSMDKRLANMEAKIDGFAKLHENQIANPATAGLLSFADNESEDDEDLNKQVKEMIGNLYLPD